MILKRGVNVSRLAKLKRRELNDKYDTDPQRNFELGPRTRKKEANKERKENEGSDRGEQRERRR